jgi:hypothetical protein
MPIPFPCATVAIVGEGLGIFTTFFTNEQPRFSFLDLNAKKRRFFNFAKGTYFGFHVVKSFLMDFTILLHILHNIDHRLG